MLVNADSLADMGNNIYLYYDDLSGKFTLLMWDANESLGKLAGNAINYDLYYQNMRSNRPNMGARNILKTRFMQAPVFLTLYEDKLKEFYRILFVGNLLEPRLDQIKTMVQNANVDGKLVNPDQYETAMERNRSFLQRRAAYLSTTDLLKNLSSR